MTLKWSKIKQIVDFSTTPRGKSKIICAVRKCEPRIIYPVGKSLSRVKPNIFSDTNWESVPATDPH